MATQTTQPNNEVELPNLEVQGTNRMQRRNLFGNPNLNSNVNVNVPIPQIIDNMQPANGANGSVADYAGSRYRPAEGQLTPEQPMQTITGNKEPIYDAKHARAKGSTPDNGRYRNYRDLHGQDNDTDRAQGIAQVNADDYAPQIQGMVPNGDHPQLRHYNKPADLLHDPRVAVDSQKFIPGDDISQADVDRLRPQVQSSGNPYIDGLNNVKAQQQEAAKAKQKQLPTGKDGARKVPGWLNRVLGDDGTKKGSRQAVQNITALGELLRHAINLYGTSKHAYNQNIADQFSINKAQYDKEDAEEAARAKAEQERQDKLMKEAAERLFKENEAKRDQGNKDRDFGLKKGENDSKAAYRKQQGEHLKNQDKVASDKNERENAMQPYIQAEKEAGAAQKTASANKLAEETKWVAPKAKADIATKYASAAAHKASAANSYASAAQHRASTLKTLKELKDNNVHSFTSGWYGTLNRDKKTTPLSKDEITSIYKYAIKQKWMKGAAAAAGYAEPSEKDMLAAISDAVGGNDGKAQHLAHYLVNQYHFTLDDGSKSSGFGNASKVFTKRKQSKQIAAKKSNTLTFK